MLFFIALLCGSATRAEEPSPPYTLKELIASTLRHNAEIAAQKWRVKGAQTRVQKGKAARILPRLRLESIGGVVPDAKGNAVVLESDSSGVRPLGPFNRTELKFVQPLYVFGATRLLAAAEKGVAVEEADLSKKRLDLTLEVKKLYYGLLLARQLEELALELADKLDEKLEEFRRDADLSLSNEYKLKFALLELEKQKRDLAEQRRLAQSALAVQAVLPAGRPVVLADTLLAPVEAKVPPLDELATRAIGRRPDWLKLQNGLAATKALEDAARGAFYPQFFLSGGLRFARAPGRTNQRNPFVKDDFNFTNFGVVFGLRQSLEWRLLGADLAKAHAEHMELKAAEKQAGQGIRLDIQKAYTDFKKAANELSSARKGRQLSRQWIRLAQEEYEFDPEQVKGLIDAFESWSKTEAEYYEAIFHYNLSVAELERKAGGISLAEQP